MTETVSSMVVQSSEEESKLQLEENALEEKTLEEELAAVVGGTYVIRVGKGMDEGDVDIEDVGEESNELSIRDQLLNTEEPEKIEMEMEKLCTQTFFLLHMNY